MGTKKLGDMWVTKTRTADAVRPDDDEALKFSSVVDDCPEWLTDAIREAHDGMLPNDWVYAECRAACERIDDDTDGDGDWLHEHADGRVDVYTSALYRWAAELCNSGLFAAAQERLDDMGGPEEDATIERRIAQAQYCAILIIAETIFAAYRDSRDEDEEDNDEDEGDDE